MSDEYAEIERIVGRNPIDMPLLANATISDHLTYDVKSVNSLSYVENADIVATELRDMWIDKTCYPDSDITDDMIREQYGNLCLAVAEVAEMLGLNPDDCVRKHVDSLIARRKKDGK